MLAGMTAMTAVPLTVIVSLVGNVRQDVWRMVDRLRAVEIAFGKVDQRPGYAGAPAPADTRRLKYPWGHQ